MADLAAPQPNPATVYDTPADLARDPALPLHERKRLLEIWEDDIREELVASEEGMTGAQKVTLADVREALDSLPVETPPRDTPAKA